MKLSIRASDLIQRSTRQKHIHLETQIPNVHYPNEILRNENTRNVEKRKFKCNRYRWTLSTRGIELLGKRESLIGSSVKKFWAKFRTREPLRDNWPLINGRGAIEFPATFSLRVHKSKRYDFVVSHPKIKLFSWKMKSCLGNHRCIYPFF